MASRSDFDILQAREFGLKTGKVRLRRDSTAFDPDPRSAMVSQDTIVNKLRELARNLWWTWQPHVIELFRELDPVLWRETDHNPVVFLDQIPPEQLVRRASEMALISRIDYAFRRLNEYLENKDSWGTAARLHPACPPRGLLLDGVRPARKPADLLWRPRRAGR